MVMAVITKRLPVEVYGECNFLCLVYGLSHSFWVYFVNLWYETALTG